MNGVAASQEGPCSKQLIKVSNVAEIIPIIFSLLILCRLFFSCGATAPTRA
jgi:hypothetical protein